MRTIIIILILLTSNLCFSESAEEFVQRYLEIRNNSDIDAYLKIVHPICIEHFNSEGKADFPKNIFLAFRRRLGESPEDAKVKISKFIEGKTKLIYPISPTHKFSVSWEVDGRNKGISDSNIIFDQDTWFIVVPDYPKP